MAKDVDHQLVEALEKAASASRMAVRCKEYLEHAPKDGNYGLTLDWSWGRTNNEDAYNIFRRHALEKLAKEFPRWAREAVAKIQRDAEERRRITRELAEKVD